jgi:hypothetical protein
MISRRALFLSVLVVASSLPSLASAQDATQCKDGYDRSQVSRDAGKLLDARKLLRQCSSASCSAFMQRECTGWLADVEARVPSVILSAKDGDGADLVDVAVTIDGKEGTRKLDGRALDIDPGEHTFAFTLASGTKTEQHVLVHEREKGKSVAVVIGARTVAANAGDPGGRPQGTSPLRLGGWVMVGAGVAGLAVGTVFGLVASSKLSAPQCDESTKQCDPGVVSSANSAATVSTVGFVAGGALVAGGLALVLLAPRSTRPSAAASGMRVGIAPAGGPSSAGLSVSGAW